LILEKDKVVKYRDRYYPIKKFGYDYWKFSFDYVEKDGLIYPRRYRVNRNHHWTEDQELIEDVKRSDIIVGHHVGFELGFLELIIPDISETKAQYCTMKLTTDVCKLPYSKYKYKWPKLEEAYVLLIEGQGLSGIEKYIDGYWHNAKYDVFASMRVYEYMIGAKFDIPWYIWLQAGVVRGFFGQLKAKVDYQVWKLKNNINNILKPFKKDDKEEMPF
jgi:DNA polymerase III epsilon subunit-like protein